MPSEHSGHSDPFEEELGHALRRTGNGFAGERPSGLVDAGMARGRRALRRRRVAAMSGSVAALALVATVGAYTGGLLNGGGGGGGGGDGTGGASVAAPAPLAQGPRGSGAVSADEMISTLKALLPVGELTKADARGTGDKLGPAVFGVIDDKKGGAAITLSLNRVDPGSGIARQQTECPDKTMILYDACSSEKLKDGSTLMVFQGYEYPDHRADTKSWRAVLATPEGHLVDVSEWNAPAQKDAAVSRPNPPLSPAQLKTLVTSDKWHEALADLPEPRKVKEPQSAWKDPVAFSSTFRSLLPEGLEVGQGGSDGDYAHLTVDDGEGKSLVGVNVQRKMGDVLKDLRATGEVTTLADGTTVIERESAGDKDVAGVVMWTADVVRENGDRVVVSAFNSATQHDAPTRAEPALTMKQLRAIALSEKWFAPEGAKSK